MTATKTARELDGLLEKVTKKTLHQNTLAKKPMDLVNNVLGPNPKKDIYVKNSRVKKHKKLTSTVSKDVDDEQGLYRESESKDRRRC